MESLDTFTSHGPVQIKLEEWVKKLDQVIRGNNEKEFQEILMRLTIRPETVMWHRSYSNVCSDKTVSGKKSVKVW